MTINFKITTCTELDYSGKWIDLHNNFTFNNFHYSDVEKKLSIYFVKSDGDWVKSDELDNIAFIHRNVSYININNLNPIEFSGEGTCLNFVSFFNKEDREINDRFVDKQFPDHNDDIIYSFMSEQFIRVCCEEIEFITF